jgi:S-DNA-T family DNA segregation ATPase FtsK/SpoIIIE
VFALILLHGEIFKRRSYERFFECIGHVGYDGRTPDYLHTTSHNQYLERIRFRSKIPYELWENKLSTIEMYLERNIYKIEKLEDITMLDILVITAKLAKFIEWSDDFMESGRQFAVGESYEGKCVWDAHSTPHGIVAGSTSSGKTTLLRCVTHQAIQKKFNVSILDFKQGGDFVEFEKYSDLENGYGNILISEPEDARDLLTALIVEVRGRMASYHAAGVSNIDQFNALGGEQHTPWLLVVDEAAEVLGIKTTNKAHKEMYAEIEQSMKTLARISRAAGVHILLGIIRPDSSVLDGQIKNNCAWRVCGFFKDESASEIVLGNARATELLPNAKGRFIIGEDEVQAYYLPTPAERNAKKE